MSPVPKHSFADHSSMAYKDPETSETYTDFSFSISSARYLDFTLTPRWKLV